MELIESNDDIHTVSARHSAKTTWTRNESVKLFHVSECVPWRHVIITSLVAVL